MKKTDLSIKKSDVKNFAIDEAYAIDYGYIQANIDSDLVIDMVNSPFRKSEDYKNGDYFISATLYTEGLEKEDEVILRIDYTDEFQSEYEEDKTVTEFYNIIGEGRLFVRDLIVKEYLKYLDGILERETKKSLKKVLTF